MKDIGFDSLTHYRPTFEPNTMPVFGIDRKIRELSIEPDYGTFRLKIGDVPVTARMYDIFYLQANFGMQLEDISRELGIRYSTVRNMLYSMTQSAINGIPNLLDVGKPATLIVAKLTMMGVLEKEIKGRLTDPINHLLVKVSPRITAQSRADNERLKA